MGVLPLEWHPRPLLGMVSLAVAGVAPPAVGEVASLADFAEVVPSADIAGSVAVGVTFSADPVGVMTFRDRCGAMDGSVCNCVGRCDGNLGSRIDEVQDDCPGGTFLAKPVGVVTGPEK